MAAGSARRWIRRIVIAVVALVLLVFAAIAIALMMVDTRMLQDRIAEEVEEATGRELHFDGALGLSFFPWIGFTLGETRLGNAPGFEDEDFARIEQVQLRLQVLPLLRRQVALDTVVLDGLALNLARDADGRSNWDDLEAAFADTDVDPEGVTERVDPERDTEADDDVREAALDLPFDIRVNGLELRNASISWRDETTGTVVMVRDLNLTTGSLALDETTPVAFQVRIEPEGAPTISVDASTRVTVSLDPLRAQLENLVVSVVARGGDDLPADGIRASLSADIDANLDAGTAVIAPFTLRALEAIELRGRTDVDFSTDEPAFSGRIDLQEFNPRDVLEALAVDAPETADPSALTVVSMGMNFEGTPARVSLQDLQFRLDDTRMEGELAAVLADIPGITTRMNFDRIDLDRYLPPPVDDDEEVAAAAPGNGEGAPGEEVDPVAELPFELLREVDAEARIRFERIGFSGLDARDTAIDIILAGGILTLEQFRTTVAEGTVNVGARVDASAATPTVRMNAELAGVQAGPISDAFIEAVPIIGRLDSTVVLNTRGDTLDDWIRRLNGRIDASFADGGVRGFNLARELRVATARYQGRDEPGTAEERQTDFSSLRYGARIDNGVVHTELLDLRAPLLRVSGEGTVDLGRERIDHLVRVLVTDALEGQEGREFEQLRGLTVPIRITGSFADPRIRIQVDEALADRVRQEAEAAREALRREQEELEQRLREERREAERRAREELERQRKEAEEEVKDRLRGILGN